MKPYERVPAFVARSGADAAGPVGGEYASFRSLPLTEAEFRRIETNVAPYIR